MEIRKAEDGEIKEALDLVWEVFMEFEAPDYCDEGIKEFENFLHDKAEIDKLLIYAAFIEKKIVGVLAMRENHISLFFVNKDHHRQGIGKSIFKSVKENYCNKKITVNSSPYAVNIYKKLGFVAKDHEQVTNGIRYTPMFYEN